MAKKILKPAAPAPAVVVEAPAVYSEEILARRRDLEQRLYALAGKPEHADKFEALRVELEATK